MRTEREQGSERSETKLPRKVLNFRFPPVPESIPKSTILEAKDSILESLKPEGSPLIVRFDFVSSFSLDPRKSFCALKNLRLS